MSLVFWYTGLIPDIALIRDRAVGMRKNIYAIFAFGWNGSAKAWSRYEIVCLILAGISTPLVLSVHTIVSMDFATSVIPGWHTTIFPPYFCGWGYLLWLCHGAHPHVGGPQSDEPRSVHYRRPTWNLCAKSLCLRVPS